jgi:ABC-type multidrug transport system fused ATPase/permease subunit
MSISKTVLKFRFLPIIKDRLSRFRNQLRFLPRTFALVRAATGKWTLGWITLLVLQGLLPVATVYLTRALVNGLVAMLITGLAMIWMVWQTARGRHTLGDLALIYQAFSQGQRLMRTLLANVGELYSNSLFLGNLFEFLDMTPGMKDPARPAPGAPLPS